MNRRLAHVGIAVRTLRDAVPLWTKLFPQDGVEIEEVEDQGVRVAFIRAGDASVELTEATREESPIARFIAKRGEGVHHLSFEVDDLTAELERLRAAGFRLIDESPRPGAGGCDIAFLHPSSTGGVLVEFSQKVRRE